MRTLIKLDVPQKCVKTTILFFVIMEVVETTLAASSTIQDLCVVNARRERNVKILCVLNSVLTSIVIK